MTHWKRFHVTRGDTIALRSLLVDSAGAALTGISTATIVSTLKESLTDTVAFASVSKAGGGIVVNDAPTADITTTFGPTVTEDLAPGAKLWGDIEVTKVDGTRGTPEHFVLIFDADVTTH